MFSAAVAVLLLADYLALSHFTGTRDLLRDCKTSNLANVRFQLYLVLARWSWLVSAFWWGSTLAHML